MGTQSEYELENNMIKQLIEQGYSSVKINNEDDLKANLREQLNKHNHNELHGTPLSDDEFRQILIHLEGGSIFLKAKKLRDKFPLKRDHKVVYIEFFNLQDWCKNEYQVTNQITMEDKRKNRYDVTLLINGLPLVQIELKRRGLEMKEAFNQTKRYAKDSYKGLFHYIQLLIISNGVNTKYYANNPEQNFKQTFFWTDKQNNRISDLSEFTDWFLEKCYVSKIIAKYIVLNETYQCLMVLRPYQFYAVEEIIYKVEQNCGNGYIWHTTGSGKTLTSFKASQILQSNEKIAKVIFVVDRKDLDSQTITEFNAFEKGSVDQSDKTSVLIKYLNDPTRKLIITTIQKLNKAVKSPKHAKQIEHLKNQKIVMIFDECHRSQFGKNASEGMHFNIVGNKDKKGFFTNVQLFGFTGTPILAFNAPDIRTTTSIFDQCLHKYLIKDAIADDNVLGFSVEYLNTIVQKNKDKKEKVSAIDTKEALEDIDRVNLIVDNILSIHNKKTVSRQFTAMFAVSNIPMLIKYYDTFKQKNHDLNIAAIFSYDINETDEDEKGLPKEQSRDALDRIIKDYNKLFATKYSTDNFSAYHVDLGKLFKKQNKAVVDHNEIDLLLVVNMFLTGYDSKPLNTLYLDKSLEAHGLVQAFSRTNRIYSDNKPYGNIVSYRNLKDKTDEALRQFSDGDAIDTVLMKPYKEYLDDFDYAITQLKDIAPSVQDVDQLQSETNQKLFVKAFRAVSRALVKLQMFSEFNWDNLSIQEQEFVDYKSKYLDIYHRTKLDTTKVSILDDISFEIELLQHDIVNFDYILSLLSDLNYQSESYENDRKHILKVIDSTPTLKDKSDLIAQFIDTKLIKIKKGVKADIEDALNSFMSDEKKKALSDFAKEENLDFDKLLRVVEAYEYSNKLNHDEIKPTIKEKMGVVSRGKKLKVIKSAIIKLVDKFRI